MTNEQGKPTIQNLESRVATVKIELATMALDSAVGAQRLSFSYLFAVDGHYGSATLFGSLGAVCGYLGYTHGKKVVNMYRKTAEKEIEE